MHALENDEMVLGGVRFLGCALWSDFDFDVPARRAEAMHFCERVVNDYEHITFGTEHRRQRRATRGSSTRPRDSGSPSDFSTAATRPPWSSRLTK